MLVMGLIFAIVGACVVWFLGSDATLICKRSTDTCILGKTSMLGRKVVVASLPLSRVKSAEVESHEGIRTTNNRGGKPTYQIVLHTDDGGIAFSNAWTGDIKAHKQNAANINTYLSSSEENLVVVQSAKTVRLIGYLFLAVGSFAFLSGLRGILRIFGALGFRLSAPG